MSIQLQSRVEAEFNLRLPAGALPERTVAALAKEIADSFSTPQ